MPDLIQKTALSRYAQRLLAARPEMRAEVDAASAFPSQEIKHALMDANDED